MGTVVCASPTFGTTSARSREILAEAGLDLVIVTRAELADPATESVAGAVALIVGTDPVDAALLDRAPALRVIAKHGAGVDNIDLEAASAHGAQVVYAPGYNATAVAEHTWGLILGVARSIPAQNRSVVTGGWQVVVGQELAEGTIGIVGMGAIGRLVARRALGMDMHVVYADEVAAEVPDAERVDLPELLRRSDVVTLHVPLSPETRNLIGTAELAMMKPSAILVNAARGGLVDETALVEALDAGRIHGAALDVLGQEPPTGNRLTDHPRALVTPHSAGYTTAALARTSTSIAQDVVAVLSGQRPRHSALP